MNNLKNQAVGFTLVEILISLGLTGIVAVGFSQVITSYWKAQQGAQIKMDTLQFQYEILRILENGVSLGAGYFNVSTQAVANIFDPDSILPQNVILLDPNTGTRPLYTVFNGNPASAPVTAKFAKNLIIRSLVLQKRSSPPGAGDVGGTVPTPFRYATTNVLVERRSIFADLIIQAENSSPHASGSMTTALTERKISLTFLVERPPGGPAPWKIAKSLSTEGMSFTLGWRLPSDCVDMPGAVNTLVECPPGTFAVSQLLNYSSVTSTSSFACACGKGGCATCYSTSTANNAFANLKCCRIRK